MNHVNTIIKFASIAFSFFCSTQMREILTPPHNHSVSDQISYDLQYKKHQKNRIVSIRPLYEQLESSCCPRYRHECYNCHTGHHNTHEKFLGSENSSL